jgi:transposase InsO family protein
MIGEIKAKTHSSVRRICKTLQLSRSCYYHAAEPSRRKLDDQSLGKLIEEIFKRHRRRYGHRRIWEELRDEGKVCALARVRRIMQERGLRAIQPKSFAPTTSDGRADKPSPNLLAEKGLPTAPDQAWAGDITYIPSSNGWLYLAVVIDLFSRRIIGWSLADHMRSSLVTTALNQATSNRRAGTTKTYFHSDRGSQYGSNAYRAALSNAGLGQSMSARANPYDNAWTESFIGTLKNEMLQGGCFDTEEDARTEVFEYIEGYYNTHRKHSSLGYKTPSEFEQQSSLLNQHNTGPKISCTSPGHFLRNK